MTSLRHLMMRNENPFDRRRDLEVPYYTVYHRFGGRRFVCFGFDPASAMVQKQNTRNVYLQTDDKRCNFCLTTSSLCSSVAYIHRFPSFQRDLVELLDRHGGQKLVQNLLDRRYRRCAYPFVMFHSSVPPSQPPRKRAASGSRVPLPIQKPP